MQKLDYLPRDRNEENYTHIATIMKFNAELLPTEQTGQPRNQRGKQIFWLNLKGGSSQVKTCEKCWAKSKDYQDQ